MTLTDTTIIVASACEGDVFEWNGVNYDSAGVYHQVFMDSAGQDSVVTLMLEWLPIDTTFLEFEFCSGDTSPLLGVVYECFGYGPLDTLEQLFLVNMHGCDSLIIAHNNVYPNEYLHGWGYVPYGYVVNGMPLYFSQTICTVDTTEHGCLFKTCFDYIVQSSSTDELERNLQLQISPNPFQTEIRMQFTLMEKAAVDISLHDLAGRKVADLFHEEYLAAGEHALHFQPADIPPGMWMLRMEVDGQAMLKKLVKK